VPTGKAKIISHRAWRITLPKLIAIERALQTTRAVLTMVEAQPTQHEGSPERCELIAAMLGPRVPYEIEILCQRWLEKPNGLTPDEFRTLCRELHGSVKLYKQDLDNFRRSRVSHEINIRSLRSFAKRNTSPLTRDELRAFRAELREAVRVINAAMPRLCRRPHTGESN
jgi:hypothetical protein